MNLRKIALFTALCAMPVLAAAQLQERTSKPAPEKGFTIPETENFWAYHPGSGYVNGKTFNESSKYCSSTGARLANQSQIMAARERGLSLCAYGWLDGGLAGFVMRGTYKGCGRDGWNSAGHPDKTRKFGAYCVGGKVAKGVPERYQFSIPKQ